MLTDTHCHLYADAFQEDSLGVLQRASEVGVSRIYLPNVDTSTLEPMRLLLKGYQGDIALRPMLGLHPCSVEEDWEKSWEIIESLLRNPSDELLPVAVGEIGLDLYWRQDNLDIQKEAMMAQVKVAMELDLPVCFHSRNSLDEILEWTSGMPLRAVYHCFSGNQAQADEIQRRGQYLGLGGTLTFASNRALREVAAGLERKLVLLETDAPYLAPVPHRGQRNEPGWVALVAQELAKIWGVGLEEVAQQTTRNALDLFEPKWPGTMNPLYA